MKHSIPVILLTGFLGAGKTTLLNYILHQQTSLKIAIIENELSNTTIDQQLLSTQSITHIANLKNGCVCCSSKAELTQTLYDLLTYKQNNNLQFDYLIIECTGMADPAPILRLLLTNDIFAEDFDIKGTIAVIDAFHAPYHFSHFNVTQSQVGMADLILVNKIDLLEKSLDPLVTQLQSMNITAPIYPIQFGQFDLNLLHQLNAFHHQTIQTKSLLSCIPTIDEQSTRDTKVNSFVIRREKAFDAEKLSHLMDQILKIFQQQLIRYKGILYIQGTPNRLVIQGIQQIYNSEWGPPWKNHETPFSELVFIGIQLPEDEFRHFFNQI